MIETLQVSFIDGLLLRCEFSTRIHIARAAGNISRPLYRTEKNGNAIKFVNEKLIIDQIVI